MAMTDQSVSDLAALLRAKGLTQRVVARRMGLDDAQLSRMLRGVRPWPERYRRSFSLATGIPLAAIREALGEGRDE